MFATENKMSKLIVMVGVSGSGKSTAAKKYLGTFGGIIVNRDKIRELIFGYTEETIKHYYNRGDFKKCEDQVSKVETRLIKEGLKTGDVVVDATHLKMSYINKLKKNFHYVTHQYNLIDTPLDLCISRDAARIRSVGEGVIRRQYNDLQNLKKDFDFASYHPVSETFINDPSNPPCILVDLDGTLALHTSGRSPYDWSRVKEDSLNAPVAHVIDALRYSRDPDYHIFIVSGRDAVCRQDCSEWLEENHVLYNQLIMRKAGDQRPDYIIKEEIWREIAKEYYIAFIIDDRLQVTEHAERLGLFVFNVNQKLEDF